MRRSSPTLRSLAICAVTALSFGACFGGTPPEIDALETSLSLINSIAYEPVEGRLYYTQEDGVWTLDPDTAMATRIRRGADRLSELHHSSAGMLLARDNRILVIGPNGDEVLHELESNVVAFEGDDPLWVLTADGLQRIDADGTQTRFEVTTYIADIGVSGDGTVFGASGRTIYQIDPATGRLTDFAGGGEADIDTAVSVRDAELLLLRDEEITGTDTGFVLSNHLLITFIDTAGIIDRSKSIPRHTTPIFVRGHPGGDIEATPIGTFVASNSKDRSVSSVIHFVTDDAATVVAGVLADT